MTMDEVNERFPMTKYKNWILSRANEVLPANGGVTMPSSRPASVRDIEGVVPQSPVGTKHSIDDRPTTALSAPDVKSTLEVQKTRDGAETGLTVVENKANMPTLTAVTTVLTHYDPKSTSPRTSEDDDDDEHIHSAVPIDLLDHPGDSCAICIDILEQDDDIRGLTCGHAFHAGCLDPWLTSRRACCPLCKADYFIPKPKPEGEAAEEPRRPRRTAVAHGAHHGSSWSRSNARFILPSRFISNALSGPLDAPPSSSDARRAGRRQRSPAAAVTTETAVAPPNPPESNQDSRNFAARWLPSVRFGRSRGAEQSSAPTPAQLEAGIPVAGAVGHTAGQRF